VTITERPILLVLGQPPETPKFILCKYANFDDSYGTSGAQYVWLSKKEAFAPKKHGFVSSLI